MSHHSSQDNNIDQHILDEFILEFNSSQIIIESLLLKLEADPQNDRKISDDYNDVYPIQTKHNNPFK